MLCSFCLNTVAAEHQVQTQPPDQINSLTAQHKLQDSKEYDQSPHKRPGKVQDVNNGAAPPADDDCE